jgi:DNA-binding transcriptional ArsR family regulator
MSPSEQLDLTFTALADPTRRAILARLAGGEATVNELAEPFDISQPAISRHLKVLERAGLVTRGRDATRRPARFEPAPLLEATKFIADLRRFFEGSYAHLDSLLAELRSAEKPDSKH